MSLSLCDLNWAEMDNMLGLLSDHDDWLHFFNLELDDGPEVDGRSGHIGKLHYTDSFSPVNEYTVPTHLVPVNLLDHWLHI